MSDEIYVSDHFYTIQGEGVTTGKPAYFLRTQGCNLQCGMPNWDEVEDKSDFSSVKDAQSDEATWTCDTMTTGEGGWMSGEKYGYEELEKEMKEDREDIFDKLSNNEANLVITGGEPLMRQEELSGFLDYIGAEEIYVEVETNATIKPETEFDQFINQYNTSPKLSNSGNPKDMRYKPEVVEWHANNPDSYFKFVTADEEDTQEIVDEWVEEFDIPAERTLLMPAGANQEELNKRRKEVVELAKEHGFQYSDRTHIAIWDEMVSV